jgi:hypothetical protein
VPLSGSGTITINRKPVSVSTLTSSVDVYTNDNGQIWLQFGKTKGVAVPVDGIEFIKGLSLGMPAGEFKWVQVINDTDIQYQRIGGLSRRGFASGIFDGDEYPYSVDQQRTQDSPGTRLSPTPLNDGSAIDEAQFEASFSMYLMWHSAVPGSIDVPLTVVHWSVYESAHWDGMQWVKLFGTFDVPQQGEDTTTHPSWSGFQSNDITVVSGLTWVDGD